MVDPRTQIQNRREFTVVLGGAVLLALTARSRPAGAHMHPAPSHPHHSRKAGPHPDPRPDVDASEVLGPDEVPPHVRDLYDGIRKIPHIADGVRCQCGCADLEGFRSLLTCFEANGMARYCEICQTEGRMVVRLHAAGRSLDRIRAAVDARFG